MLITAHFLNETKGHRDFCNGVKYRILAECTCGIPTAGVTMLRVTRNPIVLLSTVRSSRSQMSFNIGVLNNFANFTGKHLCFCLFLITFQTYRHRDPDTGLFLQHFRYFQEHRFRELLGWLLLQCACNTNFSRKIL